MTHAIWILVYDLKAEGRDDYLAWFHEVHIPEKLARPGYAWAGHYEILDAAGNPASSLGKDGGAAAGYIALFGGRDSSVFLDPAPAQIKPRQPPLTREMMGVRVGQRSFIAAEEWRLPNDATGPREAAPHIALVCCDAPKNDEAFGAWCVQQLGPRVQDAEGSLGVSKLLASVGPSKHLLLCDLAGSDAGAAALIAPPEDAWSVFPPISLQHLAGSPFIARRIG